MVSTKVCPTSFIILEMRNEFYTEKHSTIYTEMKQHNAP